jgi:hypothetical protein
MAEAALRKIDGDVWYLKVSPGRARALLKALNIALQSGSLDKSIKGVVSSHRDLLAGVVSGEAKERDPGRWVYIADDIGPEKERLTKIGHARDLVQRFARMTDRPKRLEPKAAWLFDSVAEAMKREQYARQKYPRYDGGGGREWVKAKVETVLNDLKREWGEPDFLRG